MFSFPGGVLLIFIIHTSPRAVQYLNVLCFDVFCIRNIYVILHFVCISGFIALSHCQFVWRFWSPYHLPLARFIYCYPISYFFCAFLTIFWGIFPINPGRWSVAYLEMSQGGGLSQLRMEEGWCMRAPKARAVSLGGSGGMLPREFFQFFTLKVAILCILKRYPSFEHFEKWQFFPRFPMHVNTSCSILRHWAFVPGSL